MKQDPGTEGPRLGRVQAVAQSGDVAEVGPPGRGRGFHFDGYYCAVRPFEHQIHLAPGIVTVVVRYHPLDSGSDLATDLVHYERLEQGTGAGGGWGPEGVGVDSDECQFVEARKSKNLADQRSAASMCGP